MRFNVEKVVLDKERSGFHFKGPALGLKLIYFRKSYINIV